MDAFSHTIDDLLVLETIVLVAMFVAVVMASAGIYRLIKHRSVREEDDASPQKQELSHAIQGRVIEFHVPDNFRTNRAGGPRLRLQVPARQREQRG